MRNNQQVNIVIRSIGLWLLILASMQVSAYSYSEAGKEPLIEGREALIGAMLADDKQAALLVLEQITPELVELEKVMPTQLTGRLKDAVNNKDRSSVIHIMNTVFALEIKRRLNSAEENINDYQKSKILVAKSNRFLNTIIVELDDDDAEMAAQSIKRCLKSLGNPGVFGAGAVAANPEKFKKAKQVLFESISLFE
ncbi:hypothetical protein [Alkalimarinus alittae]|uniref:HEAT repeat domain-containing protein n=1 Tax=Alkalimarinus alittae TaxID=2961619 RepID=A0ABY6N1E2_9ALTE|nr:hypothetical protein [Alkalimarinus alittae]UZE95898.1 hypothetical protein NKI27_17905 [Alkalimarinus alittae]